MTTLQHTQPAKDGSTATLVARTLTEVFAPIVLIVVLLFAVTMHTSSDPARGALLAAIAAFFVGLLPYGVMLYGIRRGRLGDRHLRERAERPLMMVFGLVSAATGLLIVRAMGAPPELFALLGAMVAGIVVSLAFTVKWKISIHAGCAAGTIAILALAISPWALLLAPIALATAWARVHLRDHTVGQVVAGLAVGAAVAATAYSLLI